MRKVNHYTSNSGYTEIYDLVNINSSEGTLANLLLLKEVLAAKEEQDLIQSGDFIYLPKNHKTYRRAVVEFNTAVMQTFLLQAVDSRGGMVCVYCGRNQLLIGNWYKDYHNKGITADHFIPVSLGAPQFDKRNIVPACKRCNQNKGSEVYSIDRIKFLKSYLHHKQVLEDLNVVIRELT